MADISDDNLAAVFIEGYASERDAFKKNELISKELPSIKENLRRWASVQHFQAPVVSPFLSDYRQKPNVLPGSADVRPFDVQRGEFPASISGCSDGGTTIQMHQGIRVAYRPWYKKDAADYRRPCFVKPHNEEQARLIEAARAANELAIDAQLFFRLSGERGGGGELFVDVHQVNLTFYRQMGYGPNGKFEQLGAPITLMEPKP
jgi:hypothetical protein